MRIELDDLFCPACRSYVHPFLERCVACGAVRPSRYDEALMDPPEARSGVLSAPSVLAAVTSVLRRHALTLARGGLVGMGSLGGEELPTDIDPGDLVSKLARPLAFRALGVPPDPRQPVDVSLAVAGGELQVRTLRTKAVASSVDLAHVVAVTPQPAGKAATERWAGIAFRGFVGLQKPAVETGHLLVTFVRHGTFGQLSLGNRSGLLASKARPDYYVDLARWLGVASVVAAEERWSEVGAPAYVAEIGLGPSAPRRVASATAAATAPTHRTATEALLELERLRAANLVTGAEYDRMRREILERL